MQQKHPQKAAASYVRTWTRSAEKDGSNFTTSYTNALSWKSKLLVLKPSACTSPWPEHTLLFCGGCARASPRHRANAAKPRRGRHAMEPNVKRRVALKIENLHTTLKRRRLGWRKGGSYGSTALRQGECGSFQATLACLSWLIFRHHDAERTSAPSFASLIILS